MNRTKGNGQKTRRGRPSKGKTPTKQQLVKLYIKEGRALRNIASILGCSKDMVYRSLKKYGIAVHSRIRKSALLSYSVRELKAGIREKGLRGFARILGIRPGTILHHLERRTGK